MSHTRFALGFPRHRKVFALSDGAFRLWISAMDHAREQNRDGKLDHTDLDMVARCPGEGRKRDALIGELVSAGLWDLLPTGWQIHDFLDWQDSSEIVNEKRKRARERMRAVRANNARTKGKRSGEQDGEPPENKKGSSGEVRHGSGSGEREKSNDPDQEQARTARVPCPKDLALTPDQRASLESGMTPGWAIDILTAKFRTKMLGRSGEGRTLEDWRSSLVTAISRDWNDSSTRPKKPDATTQNPAEELPPWL